MLMGIDAISYTIGNNFPDASVNERHCDSGAWFLDVEANGNDLVLEWRPKHKMYGLIANREILYCEGPDEVYNEEDFQQMMKRIIDLLKTGESTEILGRHSK